jgi:hypothetical protein
LVVGVAVAGRLGGKVALKEFVGRLEGLDVGEKIGVMDGVSDGEKLGNDVTLTG